MEILIKRQTAENIGGLFTLNFVTREKDYYEFSKFDLFRFKRIKLNILEQLEAAESHGHHFQDAKIIAFFNNKKVAIL